ncbi:hypothetical protein [Massilia rubra]|uniref:Uncharacterized protein n=1 Tax=Massilia rubra TaxID=2607910 RepID=A0ABX0LI55_9BURK|nr:hypothetical protein [Massilia rubra]NHZ33800.1 hypothetical protein [Massilia rubra]
MLIEESVLLTLIRSAGGLSAWVVEADPAAAAESPVLRRMALDELPVALYPQRDGPGAGDR